MFFTRRNVIDWRARWNATVPTTPGGGRGQWLVYSRHHGVIVWRTRGTGGGGTTPPPVVDTGFRIRNPAGSAKRERKTVVEIDGERFTVRDEAEARALLAQARELAEQQAPIAAKSALNKARKLKRKTGSMPTLEVAVPEIKFLSGDPDIEDFIAATQRMVDEIYLQAARVASVDLEIKQALMLAQDEDEALTLLLLH